MHGEMRLSQLKQYMTAYDASDDHSHVEAVQITVLKRFIEYREIALGRADGETLGIGG